MSLKSGGSPSRFGFVNERGSLFQSPLITIGFGFINYHGGRHLGFGSSTREGSPSGHWFISKGGLPSGFAIWALRQYHGTMMHANLS